MSFLGFKNPATVYYTSKPKLFPQDASIGPFHSKIASLPLEATHACTFSSFYIDAIVQSIPSPPEYSSPVVRPQTGPLDPSLSFDMPAESILPLSGA